MGLFSLCPIYFASSLEISLVSLRSISLLWQVKQLDHSLENNVNFISFSLSLKCIGKKKKVCQIFHNFCLFFWKQHVQLKLRPLFRVICLTI